MIIACSKRQPQFIWEAGNTRGRRRAKEVWLYTEAPRFGVLPGALSAGKGGKTARLARCGWLPRHVATFLPSENETILVGHGGRDCRRRVFERCCFAATDPDPITDSNSRPNSNGCCDRHSNSRGDSTD